MDKGKIKIYYEREANQIVITGNSEGLKYLANACLSVIGKEIPADHFHLMKEMENLEKGSINTVIVYSKGTEL